MLESPVYHLERAQFFPKSREQLFPFFQDAHNLEAITPPFLNFRIMTPSPIDMKAGALIDYKLRLFLVPIRWRTIIERFEPPYLFVDRQLWGPFKLWRHLHKFYEVEGGTLMIDRVDYQIPLGPIGRVAQNLFTRRTLDTIFDDRKHKLMEMLGGESVDDMKVAEQAANELQAAAN